MLGVLIACRRDRVACWPATDCQRSIFVDLVACAVISADAVRRDRGPTTAAIFCVASLVFSPGAAFAFFLALRAAAARDAYEAPAETKPLGRVLVVGAGASGLAAAKTLLENGAEVVIVEKTGQIGGVFADAYEGAHQVSSKYITPFSDLRLGPDVESHQSLDDYVAYLHCYAVEHDLMRYMRHASVEDVSRTRRGYRATLSDGTVEAFDRVAVCSGLHQAPKIPEIPGAFKGLVIHSQDYKEPSIFDGKRVVVVGCGETAFDVAPCRGGERRVARHAGDAARLRVRAGVLRRRFRTSRLPHRERRHALLGVELVAARRFSLVHYHEVPAAGDALRLGLVLRLEPVARRRRRHGLGRGAQAHCQQGHEVIPCAEIVSMHLRRPPRLTCLISTQVHAPHQPRRQGGVVGAPWRWLDAAEADVAVGADLLDHYEALKFCGRSVRFRSTRADDNVEVAADVVVLATGYRQTFPF